MAENSVPKKKVGTRLKHLILLTIKKATDPYFTGTSAELSFFFLMALVPIMILIAQFSGVFTIGLDMIMDIINEYVSPEIAAELDGLLTQSSSVTISIALIVLAIWASSKAQFSLSRITNYAFTGQAGGKGYIKERLRAMLSIVIILITLILAIYILVYGRTIVELITAYINDFLQADFELDSAWYMIRWPLAIVLYMLMVISIYFVLPSHRLRLRDVLPGSLFSAIGMLIATWVFSFYLANSNASILYGTLVGIVGLLLWFYVLSFVMILGIQINSVWKESGQQTGPLPED